MRKTIENIMRANISFTKIGIIVIMIGIIWSGLLINESSKISNSILLNGLDTNSVSLKLNGDGTGFYLISTDNYKNNLLAKITDSHGNILDIRKITNKVTVNYFHFEHSEHIILEMTNLSKDPINVSSVIGDTRVQDIIYPSILIFTGAIILLISAYKKLRRYITEHPDENKL